jgi:hypothetical protein
MGHSIIQRQSSEYYALKAVRNDMVELRAVRRRNLCARLVVVLILLICPAISLCDFGCVARDACSQMGSHAVSQPIHTTYYYPYRSLDLAHAPTILTLATASRDLLTPVKSSVQDGFVSLLSLPSILIP